MRINSEIWLSGWLAYLFCLILVHSWTVPAQNVVRGMAGDATLIVASKGSEICVSCDN